MGSKIDNKKKSFIFSGIRDKIKKSPLYGRTLIVLLFIALIIKGIIIYFSNQNLNPRENVISYLASDIPVIFFAHLLLIVNYWIKKRELRLINDIIVFVILLLYVVDMFTIFIFHSRVALSDIFILGSNGPSGFNGIIRLWVSVLIITGLITFFLVQSKMRFLNKSGKNTLIFFSACSFFYALFYAIIILSNANINYVEDIISLNIQKIRDLNIGEQEFFVGDEDSGDVKNSTVEVTEKVDKTYHTQQINGEGRDLNIILVFAESLSAIDSANVGGNDKIPGFDKIQKDGITFTNFITNGTTSDTAHIATLLGVVPLRNMRLGNTPYSGYKLKMSALPEFLNSEGYMTTFISAASLKFLKQREFLERVGFKKIIGEEEFESNKKYAFDAAPDADLYDRVLQEVQAQTGKYFIGLQTISFHKPYDTPLGKTEDLALKYSDDELYRFYQGLQEIGFFDNGILVIVGDHRKMNEVEEGESETFGPNRYTRSVATVVGSGIQAGTINSNLVQHTDFYNSLRRLVSHGPLLVDSIYNDIFTEETNRNRGITNSTVYVQNGYTVSLYNGDTFLFKNFSNLPKDNPIYDYFSSYISFEFGNKDTDGEHLIEEGREKIKYIGHRGAIENSPENTLESFLVAKELGADGIEFDVSYTKDMKNIVVHGEHLYASNCRNQKVQDLNFEWIQKNCTIKNGEKYMELQKMLEVIDGLFDYYFLEIKVYDESLGAQQTEEIIQTVKDLNMQDRVIFISYSDAAREVLNSDPDIIFGWDTRYIDGVEYFDSIGDNNSKYFLAPYDMLTPEIVQRAKDLGKEIVTYTVNETGDFQAMKDLGINIIMSDKIDLLKDYNKIQKPSLYRLENLNLRKVSNLSGGLCS